MSPMFPRCGLESQFGGPLDHQASARVGCLPFGVARPRNPPLRCAGPRGRPPWNPPLRSAPARWYFADTPALAGPRGPGSLAGYDRLAVTRGGARRYKPALAGPRGPGSLAGYDRLAVTRGGARRYNRLLTGIAVT